MSFLAAGGLSQGDWLMEAWNTLEMIQTMIKELEAEASWEGKNYPTEEAKNQKSYCALCK